jgi:hypothetical protein
VVSNYLHLAQSDRWAKVAQWVAPLAEGDGCDPAEIAAAEARLGFPLPVALTEWYLLAGRRGDMNHTQDALVPIEHLDMDDEWLVFYTENQSVVLWAISALDLQQSDPPVWVLDGRENFQETATFSDFIFEMALHRCLFLGKFRGGGWTAAAQIQIMAEHYPRLDMDDWHWPLYPTRRYGDVDTLITTVVDIGNEIQIDVATRSRAAFDRVRSLLHMDWEYLSEDD